MYHALLTNRYLTTRVIPLIAVAAVAMCVALVIIVVSVMTGFLEMVKDSGRTLIGDVIVSYQIRGMPYYDRLIDRLEKIPDVAAATPVVESLGLLKMPYPDGEEKQVEMVQVWGIEPEGFGRVTGFLDTLYWRPPTADELEEMSDDDFRRRWLADVGEAGARQIFANGQSLRTARGDDFTIVLGMHVSIGNERQRDGSYTPVLGRRGYWWMPSYEVWLTMVPVSAKGGLLQPETKAFQVVNEMVSGVFLIDDKRVMIPIGRAQEMLRLDAARMTDEEGDETGEIDPPRATMILVRAKDGVTPDDLQAQVAAAYDEFYLDMLEDPAVSEVVVPMRTRGGVQVQTWRQQQKQFIDPIEKERELMRVLFSIIYLVCGGLVLSIFWAIVYEKTRDIGILRSVGASRAGIALIFLRYGAVIGTIGAFAGLGLAYLVVHNINAIHDAMGEPAPRWSWITAFALAAFSAVMIIWKSRRGMMLPVLLWSLAATLMVGLGIGLTLHGGTLIWDPSVYYFSEIPNVVDPVAAVTTMLGALIFSVLGAFIPAAKAADTDPVKALRYE